MSGEPGLAADGAGCRGQAHVTRLERIDWLAIGALTLLAVAIRFYQLGSESLWGDEIMTYYRATQSLHKLIRNSIAAHQTPTYFILMQAWLGLGLGESEFLLRAPSAAFSALAVPLAYALGRLVGGRRVGLVAALLLAVSAFQVHYAQDARPYALLTFCVAVAMLGLVWLVQNPERAILSPRSWRRADPVAGLAWTGYAIGTMGALAAHNMSVFFLLAANAVFALLALRLREQWGALLRNWLLAHLVILAVWIWWWPILFAQGVSVVESFNYLPPTVESIGAAFSRIHVDGDYGLLSLSLPVVGLFGAWRLRRQPWLLATLAALLVVSPLAILAFSLVRPLFEPRQVIWTAIPFFVLAACGIAAIPMRTLFAAALVVILAEGAVKLDRYYDTQTKADWRQLTATLLKVVEPGGLVAVSPQFSIRNLIDYYRGQLGAPSSQFQFLRAPKDSFGGPIFEALKSGRPIWLVINIRRQQAQMVAATVRRVATLSELGREDDYRIYRVVPRN